MVQGTEMLTGEISDFLLNLRYQDIPGDVRQRAKEAVIDGIGVTLAGRSTECASLIRSYIDGLGLKGKATLIGEDTLLPAEFAALANGVSAHAHDFDDTQISEAPDRVYGLLTHPTTPVLSAAIPVAEEVGASGERLLTAFVAGVEIACKVAEAINPYHYKNGFHSTGTIGIFGAAAAAAKLYGLNLEATRHALGIAASKSAGIRVAFGTMTKPYHAGAAAEGGVVAAKLAGLGYKTDPDALDGPWGFFQVAGSGVDREFIHGKLGNPFSFVSPGVSIKPYPCGSLSHPSMDSMLDLILEHDVQPETIDTIRLGTTSNVLAALRYQEPMNELEAKFSIPFCLAVLALYRRGGIAQFSDEVVLRPEVRQMMGRVTPYLHEDLEAQGFQRIRSLLEITLLDGTELTKSAETSRGTPDRPMTSDELAEKFMDCNQGILSAAAAEECLDLIMGLEGISHIDTLTGLLRG